MRVLKVRFGTVVRAMALLATALLLAPVQAPSIPVSASPTLEASPADDLRDGQSVQVRGNGFGAGQALALGLCKTGTSDLWACRFVAGATVGDDGTTEVDVVVGPAVLTVNPVGLVDCRRAGACELIAFLVGGEGTPLARLAVAFDADSTAVLPQLEVSPAVDLVHHQSVSVTGTGFAGSTRVTLTQCGSSGTACAFAGSGNVATDGSFTVSVQVSSRLADPAGGAERDCRAAADACVLVATATPSQLGAFASLAFAPDAPAPRPELAVSPERGLVDGQTVTVTGAGFAARSGLTVAQCVAGSPAPAPVCGPNLQGMSADATGRATGSYQVSATMVAAGRTVDCRVTACELRVLSTVDPVGTAALTAALAFEPAGPLLPPPVLTVSPATNLRDGQSVDVRIDGLRAGPSTALLQCEAGVPARDMDRCRLLETIPSSEAGTIYRSVMVDGSFAVPGPSPSVPGTVDCTVAPGCQLVLGTADAWVTAPISFAPTGTGMRYRDRLFTEVEVTRDLVYGRAVGAAGAPQDLTLDLYQPRGDQASGRSAVVYIHGGWFSDGDKREGSQVAIELARRGHVVVSINYRLYPGERTDLARLAVAMPAAQHDAQAAVRWLRANAGTYRLDPRTISAMGYSAGGVTALNLANHSRDPGDSGNPGYPSGVAGAVSLSGAPGGVEPGAAPSLLFHGTQDTVVPYAAAVEGCQAARRLNNICELVSYEGVGHDIYRLYQRWMPSAVEFLRRMVDRAQRAPAGPDYPGVVSGSGADAGGNPAGRTPPATPVVANPRYTG